MSPALVGRDRMTMRANLQRNTSAADAYGGKAAPATWTTVDSAAPCFVWTSQKREVVDGTKVAVVEVIHGTFPASVDVRTADRLLTLQDRRGQTVLDGPLEVDAVTERSAGPGQNHREVVLRRHRG